MVILKEKILQSITLITNLFFILIFTHDAEKSLSPSCHAWASILNNKRHFCFDIKMRSFEGDAYCNF